MIDIKETKSGLAKLLATENIIIQHLPTSTAYFNLEDRVLICPVWKEDMPAEIYDRLLAHEVSHALHTPVSGWGDMLKNNKHLLSIMQVVEDVRVDKLIVKRYPGLRKPFVVANKILFFDKDFFDVKRLNGRLELLNLVDRINLESKVGAIAMVKFLPEEQNLVDRIFANEDWENVIPLSQELYDFIKKQHQNEDVLTALDEEMLKQLLQDMEGHSGNVNETTDVLNDGTSSSSVQSTSGNIKQNMQNGIDKQNKQHSDTNQPNIESVTDQAYHKNEQKLIERDEYKLAVSVNMYLPEVYLNKAVIPADIMETSLRRDVDKGLGGRFNCNYYDIAFFLKRLFEQRNKKYISMLVKEFEMRKNATEYARKRESRIGEIDTRKLYRYKFSDDIFRRMVTVDKGKSHGLVMFIDFSASMCGEMSSVMEQLLILVSFCKKVNIPFDVYGFGNSSYHTPVSNWQKIKSDTMQFTSSFGLYHLISSTFTSTDFKRYFNMLLIFGESIKCQITNKDLILYLQSKSLFSNMYGLNGFGSGCVFMSSTPYLEALVCSIPIIENFKLNTKVDIVNVIHLTDGDGNSTWNPSKQTSAIINSMKLKPNQIQYGFVHKPTGKRVVIKGTKDTQYQFVNLVRMVTGCKQIGYYVGHRYSLYTKIRDTIYYKNKDHYIKSGDLQLMLDKEMIKYKNEMKLNNFVVFPMYGYDNYYLLSISNDDDDEGNLPDLSESTKNQMYKALSKATKAKHNNTVLLRQFTKDIAEEL